MKLSANTAFGLESVLKRELTQLNILPGAALDGRVFFTGTWETVYLTNLYLRTAEHVYIVLKEAEVKTFDAMFDAISTIPFERFLRVDGAFIVHARSKKSHLMSERTVQSLTKKAIIERLKSYTESETFNETGPRYTVRVIIHHDQMTVELDTSGEALHKRGYRLDTGDAPLKETLAAGLVLLTPYDGTDALYDPFCGSGTILIEAAMRARNIPPGLMRSFAFETFISFAEAPYKSIKKTAYEGIDQTQRLTIVGSDMDGKVLEKAQLNAERAGVEDDITWQHERFEMKKWTNEKSFIITNPPYDERMSSPREIKALYTSIGRTFNRLTAVHRYMISSVSGTEQYLAASPTQTRVLFNGPIKARYYQFFGR